MNVSRHINVNCDPDFLTIFFDDPRNLQESDLVLQFGESTYAVKVVTHWDKERRKSAVSVQKSDGWWWHGTDVEQATHYRYTEKQICKALSKAIVLMCVRVVPLDSCEENDEDMEELVEFANSRGETEDMEELIESANSQGETRNGDGGSVEVEDEEEEEQNLNGNDINEEESRNRKQSRYYGSGDPNLLYDYEAALVESRQANPNLKTQISEM